MGGDLTLGSIFGQQIEIKARILAFSRSASDAAPMCAKHLTKSISTSRCGDVSEDKTPSPVRGNTVRSRYRVLRAAMERSIPRSVDRNCAGPKAKPKGSSLKGSSPDKQHLPWWPSVYEAAKATPEWKPTLARVQGLPSPHGTTGVQDLGMYRRLILELGISLRGRSRQIRFDGQRLKPQSKIIPSREVRCLQSSEVPVLTQKEVG
jgi:hypothetical protein